MIPSLEGWPTQTKKPPSPHEVRLSTLDTNPVFQCLGDYTDESWTQNEANKPEENGLLPPDRVPLLTKVCSAHPKTMIKILEKYL